MGELMLESVPSDSRGINLCVLCFAACFIPLEHGAIVSNLLPRAGTGGIGVTDGLD